MEIIRERDVVVLAYSLSPQEVDAGGPGIQGLFLLYIKLKASLNYRRVSQKKNLLEAF